MTNKKLELSKIETLATHLDVEQANITQCENDENVFHCNDTQYLVLTDEEAQDIVESNIQDNLWQLGALFLHQFIPDDDIDPETIVFLKLAKEKANHVLRRLLLDPDGKQDGWLNLVNELLEDNDRAYYITGDEEQEEIEANGYFIY